MWVSAIQLVEDLNRTKRLPPASMREFLLPDGVNSDMSFSAFKRKLKHQILDLNSANFWTAVRSCIPLSLHLAYLRSWDFSASIITEAYIYRVFSYPFPLCPFFLIYTNSFSYDLIYSIKYYSYLSLGLLLI